MGFIRQGWRQNIAEFKKINILYGRNYSGKTTLSRIFRALEPVRSPINISRLNLSCLLTAVVMPRKTH
ncbi:AAA family ATPase [Halopseudomonas pachastrellae]|nr:AAA family ATPase [Halopseudomonas pachastrellae]